MRGLEMLGFKKEDIKELINPEATALKDTVKEIVYKVEDCNYKNR